MHVFETMAVRQGALLLADIHRTLLASACDAVGFPRPADGWLPALSSTLHDCPDGVARVICTAGDGGPMDPVRASRLIVIFEAMAIHAGEIPASGTAELFPMTPGVVPWVKSGNYWPHLIAQQHGVSLGANETVLVTPDGKILSGAMGNIFVFLDGQWITPMAGEGVRPGAVREWLIGIDACEPGVVRREDLPRATSAFFSNSRVGLRPLVKIGGYLFPDDRAVRPLWDRYRQDVLYGNA